MEKYNFQEIEPKWQKKWEEEKLYKAEDESEKAKKYILLEFPYPSGAGLHVGHCRSYSALDAIARKKRMEGYNVLFPIGWDAFGLPTENYAIKHGIHPKIATAQNIKNFKRQIKSLGLSFDWSREINTTDPKYYKWTQWIFLKLFEKGLAYQAEMPINWCPSCRIGLANEEVVEGKCERCGALVEKKIRKQWMLKITAYADRLVKDLGKVDYPERVKTQQINWIGRSCGTEVKFKLNAKTLNAKRYLNVFTTRPDTLFGCTYLVVAPEHEVIRDQESGIRNHEEVKSYIKKASKKSDLERTGLIKEKTGIELEGIKAINPVDNQEIPIWVADYVLPHYGTGAIMAVPGHDERDFEFAKKYKIDIRQVIIPENNLKSFFMQGSFDGDIEKELKKNNLNYAINNKGGFYITLKLSDLDHYIRIIKKHLKKEFWCEIIGAKTIFIYGDGEIIEVANERGAIKALKKCKEFYEPMNVHYNLWEMLWNCEFYHDILCFTEDGININSDFLDGLKTEKAKEKIIKWLEEKKVGKRAVNYKLRDWIFSRQHYWGEPIPLVYCENCKNKKYNYVLLHGVNGNSQSNFLPWLKKELEKQGHNVFCPDLPNTDNPNINEQISYILKNTKINKDTVFVSWSLAGALTMKLLEKTNKKVAKVLFIDSFIKPKFTDNERPEVEKSCDWQFDFEKIKELSNEFIVLAYSEFSVISKKQSEQIAKLFNAKLLFKKPNDGHFCDTIEPEILEQLENTGWIPVPEKDLPVDLPFVEKYKPTKTGESPLANVSKWVNTKCPRCGSPAKRETDTMPNWAGSSWYFMRYIDPGNNKELASKEKLKYWMPVDWYNGGMEHTTLHLLYSRFWYKFLFDIGIAPQDEPYQKRTSHGIVLAEDGRKMSKSFGNVINPDDVVQKYGADTLRIYEMFMGPFDQAIAWSADGVKGVYRFLEKVWKLALEGGKNKKSDQVVIKAIHKLNKKIDENLEATKFNTLIAAFMEFVNFGLENKEKIGKDIIGKMLILLAPFAPHLSEELWSSFAPAFAKASSSTKVTEDRSEDKKASADKQYQESIFRQKWPKCDPKLIREKTFNLIIQINGKFRDKVKTQINISQAEAEKISLKQEKIKKWTEGKEIKKIIFVPKKLINMVTNP